MGRSERDGRQLRHRRFAADTSLGVGVLSTALVLWLTLTTTRPGGAGSLAIAASGVSFGVVGALIARRRPDNRLPWVLVAIGLLGSTGNAAQAIVDVEVHRYGADAAPWLPAHWYAEWFWLPWLVLQFVVLPLLFPTGRPLSDRWRVPVRAALAFGSVLTPMAMFQGQLPLTAGDEMIGAVDNPLGLLPYADLDDLIGLLFFPLMVLALLAVISLVSRFRSSDAVERRQMKVVLYAVVLTWGMFMISAVTPDPSVIRPFEIVTLSAVPAAIGVAVLRYRLYDIDRVISRTVAYALVTLILAGIYVSTVLVLGGTLRTVTGQDSPLVVAASTLAAAAAFRPVRMRVQRTVERRFNRTSYDARLAVDRFGVRLRTELDPRGVTSDMIAITQQVLSPSHASVWMIDNRPAHR